MGCAVILKDIEFVSKLENKQATYNDYIKARDEQRKSQFKLNRKKYKYIRRRKPSIQEKVINNLRKRIKELINNCTESKSGLIGCSGKFLVEYIEKQFSPLMTWTNYGIYWHIDHKIPCAAFDLTKPEDRQLCFHYSNLQPLEKIENIIKSDFLPSGERAKIRMGRKKFFQI